MVEYTVGFGAVMVCFSLLCAYALIRQIVLRLHSSDYCNEVLGYVVLLLGIALFGFSAMNWNADGHYGHAKVAEVREGKPYTTAVDAPIIPLYASIPGTLVGIATAIIGVFVVGSSVQSRWYPPRN